MRQHVGALFTQDRAGRLVAVNEPGGKPAPRFFLGSTVQGHHCWFRHDIEHPVVEELQAMCDAQPPSADLGPRPALVEQVCICLARVAAVERVWAGPAFVCPPGLPETPGGVRVSRTNADLLSPYLDDWRDDVEAEVPMAASLQDGRAVSVCCSVRVSHPAHEAGVETHPDFRGRGHGARAVAEWAKAVREVGRVPLYSTSWENTASRALAARLRLAQFGADLHIT